MILNCPREYPSKSPEQPYSLLKILGDEEKRIIFSNLDQRPIVECIACDSDGDFSVVYCKVGDRIFREQLDQQGNRQNASIESENSLFISGRLNNLPAEYEMGEFMGKAYHVVEQNEGVYHFQTLISLSIFE